MKKLSLLLFYSLFVISSTHSQIVDPFAIRYQNQQKGGIRMLANASVTCSNCTTSQNEFPPAGNGQNNNFNMNYIDVDGISSTFMSSSDSLNLQPCSEVLWAGLYWTGRVGTGGAVTTTTNYTLRNQVSLRTGTGAYQTLTADEITDNTVGHQTYHCFKNITSIVQANGNNSRYTIANVVTRTGSAGVYGGWTIVVVYKNIYESMRNLTVFDGLANVSSGNTVTIPITGFLTPLVGPVSFELGVVSHDGDRSQTGDQLQFNGAGTYVNVSDAIHATNDVFNSTISRNGVLTPFRIPSYNNTLGHDANVFLPINTTFNYIGNNANSANIRITTGGETILTSVVTSVIDVYEPDLRATVYMQDLNGGQVNPGDQLEYTLVGKNIGSDISLNTFMSDTLDPRTSYVPNSISVFYGPNSGPKTDAYSDDQAEYDPINRVIIARIGTGANALNGGSVVNSPQGTDSTVVKFRVQVINDCLMFQCDPTLEHKAYIFGSGNISGNAYNNGGLSDLVDANGCPTIANDVLTINVSGCPTPAVTYNSPLCVSENLQLTVPFSSAANYSWTGPNGFTSTVQNPSLNSVSSANQGNYQVQITFNGLDCEIDTFTTVIVQLNPSIQLLSQTNVLCFGNATGALSVASSGAAPNTFSWSNGSTSTTPTGLSAGTYTVTVTDANTCQSSSAYTITQPSQIVGSISATTNFNGFNVSCFGSTNGAASVSASGGVPGYTYLWNNGSTLNTATNLPAGPASVVVTDANACPRTFSVGITQPTTITITSVQTNVSCFSGANGALNITVTGGAVPYTYVWSNGSSTQDVSGLTAGVYSVTVTDANGCTKLATYTITQPNAPLSLTETHVDVLCFGNATGSIDVSPAGGTPTYSYSWSNGATSQDLTNLPAGTYTLVLTDSKGCILNQSIVLTQPTAPLNALSTITDVACYSDSTGSIDLTVSGGTMPYAYNWSNTLTLQDLINYPTGTFNVTITDFNLCSFTLTSLTINQPIAPLSASSLVDSVNCYLGADGSVDLTVLGGTAPYDYVWTNGSATQDLTNLTQGTYSVIITDANDCSLNLSSTVYQPLDSISILESIVDVLCFGQATGAIDASPQGGTLPYTFSWNTGALTEDVQNLISSTYSLTVTDINGCSKTESYFIDQPANPLTLSETHTNALCIGGQQGTIDLTITGGSTPYSIQWNNNTTIEDQSNLLAGNYVAWVTDDHGCLDSIQVEILDPSNTMSLSETHVNVLCFGASTGSIDLIVTGGVPTYTYDWNTGSTNQDLTGLPAGLYSVNVYDFNSCGEFLSITILEPSTPVFASSIQTDVLCFGALTGAIDVTPQGGVGPYTFLWNTGETTEDISNVIAGNYAVTITDFNGCVYTFLDTIYQPALPLTLNESHVNVLCNGGNNGSIDIVTTGGTAPYTYLWDNAAIVEDLSNLIAGTYTVTVTDANGTTGGCYAQLAVSVTEPLNPVDVSASQVDILCFGGNTGSVDVTVSGGTAPYAYTWNTSANSEDLSSLVSGTYSVVVTDANGSVGGCTDSITVVLTQPLAPVSVSFNQLDVLCFSNATGEIDLDAQGGTAPYTYAWSNGGNTQDVTGLIAGTYSVLVTDANGSTGGCAATTAVTIAQPLAPLTLSETHVNILCFGNNTGSIDLSVSGGTAGYSYVWSNTETSQDIDTLIAGNYIVDVKDANDCQAQLQILISQPLAPLTEVHNLSNISCFAGSDGNIDLTTTGGTIPYTFIWTNGFTTEDLLNVGFGTYSVLITDANNCTLSGTYALTEPASPLTTSTSFLAVNCYGESNGTAIVNAFGGTQNYTYLWNNGATTSTNSNLIEGNYSVIVTDANGCISTNSVYVTEPTPIVITSSQVDVLCYGASTGSAAAAASGGVGFYNYVWSTGLIGNSETNLQAGSYTIYVNDGNQCLDSLEVNINQPADSISINLSGTDILCYGFSTGAINATVTGATAPFAYVWNTGSTNEDLSNLPAGTYDVQVTDAHACVYNEAITLLQPAEISIQNAQIENVSCNDFTDAFIDISVVGGVGPYDYAWNNGATSEDLIDLSAGSYFVVINDANSCVRVFNYIITQPDTLFASFVTVEPTCFGYTNGSINVTTEGGTAPYSFTWSNGMTSNLIQPIGSGNYAATITDANGCMYELDATLGQPEEIQVTFDADVLEGCDPLEVNFANTSDELFLSEWYFGDGTTGTGTQIQHIYYGADCYDVTLVVTDAIGCTNELAVADFICVLPTPTAAIEATNTQLNSAEPTTEITNASVGAVSYIWNLGDELTDYYYFQPGEHTYPIYNYDNYLINLIAIGENGCSDTANLLIEFDNSLIIYVPNTFTPNGDEMNQVFKPIIPAPVTSYRLRIYNRWGELIFESFDPTNYWDGSYNGEMVSDGMYTWEIIVVTVKADSYKNMGHVNVLR
jgi:large repetitive protein